MALTPKAFDLLSVLVKSCDRVVEKDELMQLVWPDSFVTEDSLTQHVAAVRRALGDAADRPRYILTVPRHGYRFVAAVKAISADTDESRDEGAPVVVASQRPLTLWSGMSVAVLAVTMLMAVGLGVRILSRPPSIAPTVKFMISPPEGTTFSPSASFPAVSPNGRLLAFLASRPGEEPRLWVRALDSLTARELTGTAGALGPFWSPDSRYLAFFANGTLKKVSLLGEVPAVLCEAPSIGVASGTWHQNGVILFTQPEGIYRTSSTGSAAMRVTSVDRKLGESAHVLPQFLPDGQHFVYTASIEAEGSLESWISLRSFDSADDRRLFTARSQALYANRDSLLFLRDGVLMAQPFDAGRLQLGGDPVPVPGTELVGFNPAAPRGMFSVSENGVLAYRTPAPTQLGWFDRTGTTVGGIDSSSSARNPALSHNGRYLAISRYDVKHPIYRLWIFDLDHGGAPSPFTARSTWETCAVWSHDDKTLVYERGRPENGEIYEKTGADEERVLPYRPRGCPLDWTRDGRYVLYGATRGYGSPGSGLWLASFTGDQQPTALPGSWPIRPQARISPDGHSLAYVSDSSGRNEVYVRSFPNGTDEQRVSSEGGIEPQWRGDGRELFFIGADRKLMAATITSVSPFLISRPAALFLTELDPTGQLGVVGRNQYLASRDGQRFLINQTHSGGAPSTITVVVNWPSLLKK